MRACSGSRRRAGIAPGSARTAYSRLSSELYAVCSHAIAAAMQPNHHDPIKSGRGRRRLAAWHSLEGASTALPRHTYEYPRCEHVTQSIYRLIGACN